MQQNRSIIPGTCSNGACGFGTSYTETQTIATCTCGCSGGSCTSTPSGYGGACQSPENECSQTTTGVVGCGGCSATTAPSLPAGYGNSCTSSANSCGMTNSGTIGCSGSCSASTPSDSLCPPPPPPNYSPSAASLNRELTTQEITPCTSNVHFTWSFSDPEDGANQSGYQLQVDDSSSFSSVNYDTGSVSTSSKERYVSIGSTLSFNTTYYWRLRVRDSGGQWSSYVSGSNFSTPVHAAPTPNFTWTPSTPSSGESVQFVDQSSAAGGASITGYSWSFASGTPSSSSDEDPTTVFGAGGTQSATLEVTDSAAISCSITKSVSVSLPLPDIEEIPPTTSIESPFGFLGGILERMAAVARAVQGE